MRSYESGEGQFEVARVIKPTALTIDYQRDRLFWVAALDGVIEGANLDGSNRTKVYQPITWSHGLSLYENYLYWTENDKSCAELHLKNKISPGQTRAFSCDEVAVYRVHLSGGSRERVWGCSKGLPVGIEAYRKQEGDPIDCQCEGVCLAKNQYEETCSECLGPNPPYYCPGVWFEERRAQTDGILYMILFAVIMLLLTLIIAIILSCIPRDDQPDSLKSPANNQCVSLQSPPLPE